MKIVVDIADAVVIALNGGSFVTPFTSVRMFRPEFKAVELAELKVAVVPRVWTSTPATRDSNDHTAAVEIAVMKRVADELSATVDPLITLAGEIAAAMEALDLPDLNATCTLVENVNPESILVLEHLRDHHVFTCVVRATFTIP